jgi:hypothetical protein
MGRGVGIANPLSGIERGSAQISSPAFPEQCIGGRAVGCGLVPVRDDSLDFSLQQRNPLTQFGLRIWREIFRSEATRSIAFGPWAIRFFHWGAASQAKRLAVNRRDGYSRSLRG